MDESLPWEERYKQLEAHHKEETEWMIVRIKELEKGECDKLEDEFDKGFHAGYSAATDDILNHWPCGQGD